MNIKNNRQKSSWPDSFGPSTSFFLKRNGSEIVDAPDKPGHDAKNRNIETSPGPQDSHYLFERFVAMMGAT